MAVQDLALSVVTEHDSLLKEV